MTQEGIPYCYPKYSNTHMPKYKIDPIPGMPEWLQFGIVCKVRNNHDEPWVERAIITYLPSNSERRFMDKHIALWKFAEPVEQWEPCGGELVAAWNEGKSDFMVGKYERLRDIPGFNHVVSCGIVQHVARLQYSDGRVIDCACSVEELKTRTEWV